jgi:predicted RecB family nuclease
MLAMDLLPCGRDSPRVRRAPDLVNTRGPARVKVQRQDYSLGASGLCPVTRELSLPSVIVASMQLIGGQPVFAATDLVGYLACEHLVGLELAAMAGLVERPVRLDPEIDLIAKRGLEHEARYLADLERDGRPVTRLAGGGRDVPATERLGRLQAAAAETEAALRRGDAVIYQATFFDGRWLGLADFVVRVERPSALGGWSYEVVDTKLARHVKASALLQICSYVERLTAIQGLEPEFMHVALGGSSHTVERHRVADYMAYYRTVKAAFEARVAADGGYAAAAYPPAGTYPEPVEHCDVCRWRLDCAARRRADDDLSLVANAPSRMRRTLKGAGVPTRRGLAALELPLPEPLDGVGAAALATARDQAAIQVRGEDAGRILHELLPLNRLPDGSIEPNRGLTSLPEPRPGDLFFDIEGDPFALEDGVEYLFGVLEPGLIGPDGDPAGEDPAGEEPTFHAFWAVDETGQVTPEAERRAFEATIDLMTDRLAADPQIHIYHYASYEPAAAGRLMGRHATREEEVDRLLRGDVFVDLFRAVRQGLRASVESYSIKKLEPLYGLAREEGLRDAGSSIVAFESWLAEVDAGSAAPRSPATDETLQSIQRYNRDDCVSNWQLRDWLEGQRRLLTAELGEPLPRPAPGEPEPAAPLSDRLAHVADIAERLCVGVPEESRDRTPQQQARWLLAQLLSWHRREEKSFWWRYFHLMEDLTDEDRVQEREPIGRLAFVRRVGETDRSVVYRYRYPEQEHAIVVGTDVRDPATGRSPGSVIAIDDAACTVDLKRGPRTDGPHPTSLVPYDRVGTEPLQESLLRIGEWVAGHDIDGPGDFAAARELLMRRPSGRRPPGGGAGESLCRDGESVSEAARRIAPALNGGWLAVQGPPGSGKTYLGAEVVVELVRLGRKVGVTANSHRVIGHLLDSVAARAAERGVEVRIGQKPDRSGDCTSDAARPYEDYDRLLDALAVGEVNVVGGTAWLWSRPEFAESLDVLVIDEAGQLSLANAVAVSGAACGLVLLGDPQQLDQPLQGTHPPGAEASALGHILDGKSTMPPEVGLFLERTRRLHPDLCRFTSEAFYESRLASEPWLARQELAGSGVMDGTGVRFVPVAHEGNRNDSPEEAAAVAALIGELMEARGTWTDGDGRRHELSLDDVLVVAPYNAQVAEIARSLPGVRAGTVDKFQGQEAPVSLYSMATSSPEDAPRGMEFLYSLNRLNVATSRARCLAVVVASPALIRVRARTPRQMKLANALCRFLEMAARG